MARKGDNTWRRWERDLSEAFGGRVTVGSGNQQHDKLDVQQSSNGSYWRAMVEAKFTARKSYSVTLALLEEIIQRAYERGSDCRPMLALRFGDASGKPIQDWVALPVDDLLELLMEARQH